MSEAKVRLNRTELAQAMRVTPPTIDRWIADGMPVAQKGGNGRPYEFDLDDCRAWREGVIAAAEADRAAKAQAIREAQAELDLEGGGVDGIDALPFKAQREYYETQAAYMRVARERRELVRVSDVRRQVEATFGYLADRLQTLPDILERECNLDSEAVATVMRAVDEFQDGLARELELGAADAEPMAAAE